MMILADMPRKPVIEPLGRMLVIDPGNRVQKGPELLTLVIIQNRVDVEADRQSNAAVFGVNRLNPAIARRRPRFLRQRPGIELAIVGHHSSVRRGEADGVEILWRPLL